MPTRISEDDAAELSRALKKRARDLGFSVCRITTAEAIPAAAGRLRAALDAGHHGDMAWMEETEERRSSPKALWPEVRSVVMLGLNYGPESDPMQTLGEGAVAGPFADIARDVGARLDRVLAALPA